ncbi:MAG TPA: cupin domain-containing protein [Nitrosopumilaceae archaeon]|nr:cupin domain-containing protein [Nitrosopumilaceae archaeon]
MINGIRKHSMLKIQFDTNQFLKDISKGKSYFHTFINKENLAAGIILLKPGDKDTQGPHDSDEIYYIIRGDGFLNIDGKDHSISEGMSYYVAKNIQHKFHGNKKELVVLYFFGGPDS